jgi:hypothetical protein
MTKQIENKYAKIDVVDVEQMFIDPLNHTAMAFDCDIDFANKNKIE